MKLERDQKKCQECGKPIDWGKHADKIELESGFCSECWTRPFKITSVCRADLQEEFTAEQISKLDDGDMERLASKMADSYCDNSFWIDLPIIVDYILKDK